jgi:hypothetical protein
MPTYIKTGYWDKKAKAPDGWLDLNQFVQTLIPPTPPPTPSTNIYNSDGTLTGNRVLQQNNNFLSFNNGRGFIASSNNFTYEISALNQFYYLRFYYSPSGTRRLGLRQEEHNSTQEGLNLILGDNTQGHLRFNYNQNISGFSNSFENTSANWIGLKLDFANKEYWLGENTQLGFSINVNTQELSIGDIGNVYGGTTLKLDFSSNNGNILTRFNNNDIGLKLDFANSSYQFGQITGGNTKTFTIDDAAAFGFQFSGTGITQGTTGATSGQYLKVNVGGTDYVIELKNPS